MAQPALIAHPSTLIASPAQTVLTATPAKPATLEQPAIAAHLITTVMGLPARLALPLIATVLPALEHQLAHLAILDIQERHAQIVLQAITLTGETATTALLM